MSIDWRNVRNITAREIIRALIRDGFELRGQSGRHRRYRHADGRRVTVTFHSSGQTFSIGTLRRMIQDQAQWTEEDLRGLGLV